MKTPIVAIVGRPNVGKSTLFNKLSGKRLSIVDDMPGVTRDALFAKCDWNNKEFIIIDTGGFETKTKHDEILKAVNTKTKEYIDKADVILFVVNLKDGILAVDIELSNFLKRTKKPIILCINKCDSIGEPPLNYYDFFQLSQTKMFAISAIHGHGVGDLLDEIVKNFKDFEKESEKEDESRIKVAILGKPNVGKSSLINAILKKEQLIVSNVAGTTRDSIDILIKFNNKEYIFIDTAGLRKKNKITEKIEKYSAIRSFFAIERADVCILLLDATNGAVEQDLKIAGYINKKGKSLIVAINKWDLIEKDENTAKNYEKILKKHFNFMKHIPYIFISVKTKQRLNNIFPLIEDVNLQANKRLTTGMLNEILSYSVEKMQPPSMKGKKLKIYYITQVSCKPPTFAIFVNNKNLFHFSYKRYLENQIRKEYKFLGNPLKFIIKENKK